MKVSGIICEYNPFHNGHHYHIQKTRENGATHIVAIMSGNFVQRGDVALIDKFERAKVAVRSGIDLVIELPVAFALSTAETFARGAMHILNAMGCVEEVSFGSESGDISKIISAVKANIECSKSDEMKNLLENGFSYPSALYCLVEKNYGKQMSEIFDGPNNILAIEYVKALAYLNSKISPFTITRKNAGHDEHKVFGNFASASFIRQNLLEDNDCHDLMPNEMATVVTAAMAEGRIASLSNLEKIILYKMRTISVNQIRDTPDVGQGLENKIYASKTATSLEELMHLIKNKRYPMARIRRILLNALIGINKNDLMQPPVYGRILAINERGTDILNAAKGKSRIPFATSLSKLSEINAVTKRFAELEALSTDIYNLATKTMQTTETDYRAKIGVFITLELR